MKNLSWRAEIKESETLRLNRLAKELAAKGHPVVSLVAGEPDFDTPETVKQAGIKAIEGGKTKYTAVNGILELRQAVCRKLEKENGLKYSPENICISSGAKHSIANALFAVVNDGDEVLVISPYWTSYPEMVRLAGGVPVIVYTLERDGFQPDPAVIESRITSKTKAMIINSPCNPTGAVYSEQTLRAIAQIAVKHDVYVITDEIYEKIVFDGARHVCIASFGKDIYDLSIVVNGVSKSHAMTGWRMGYTAAPAPIAKAIANIQSQITSNPTSISQYATLCAMTECEKEPEEFRRKFQERRDYFHAAVRGLGGYSALKPGGTFYLYVNVRNLLGKACDGKTMNSSCDVAEILLNKFYLGGVPGEAFGTSEHIRFSYASDVSVLKEAVKRLKNLLDSSR